jgi:hypothetical protein
MGALKAQHVEDSLLRGKHGTTTNGTNLDGRHRYGDEQIFAIVCSDGHQLSNARWKNK